ncbi:hypothetical protein [Pedobacter mucosus]|uniref:hypothetical protein n=1 Tax=Pedobacter mucosus TaxID=2895286 RepID=UPI001EE3D868|nr:hypothetical protein [Pedobacter mucosus]UKT64411.1 hypothetical protein LOK61_01225 [Pedobacter mucosus]
MAQLTGCYSVTGTGGLGRFYYRQISGNNYNASTYATSGLIRGCNSFTSISVSSTPCQVNSTSYSYTFIAIADVPVTCLPLDDYIFLLILPIILFATRCIRKKNISLTVIIPSS